MKLKELLFTRSEFEALIKRKDLKGSLSYKISKAYLVVKSDLETFDKTKNDLVQKYGEPIMIDKKIGDNAIEKVDTGEKKIDNTSPNWDKYIEELEELGEQEVDLSSIKKIKIHEFKDLTISAESLIKLNWLIQD